jgi:hypothetical protein
MNRCVRRATLAWLAPLAAAGVDWWGGRVGVRFADHCCRRRVGVQTQAFGPAGRVVCDPGAAIALLVGMLVLVMAEALVPSGTMPGPLYLIRGLRKRVRRARRYSQITGILVRRGVLPYLRGARRDELKTHDGRVQLARTLRLALKIAVGRSYRSNQASRRGSVRNELGAASKERSQCTHRHIAADLDCGFECPPLGLLRASG